MIDFIKCVFTGLGELAKFIVFIGLVGTPVVLLIYGMAHGYDKLAESHPSVGVVAKKVVKPFFITLILCSVAALIIVAIHDWGCVVKGHPEHRVFKDAKPNPGHEHKQ